MQRSEPVVEERYEEIPDKILDEIRDLFEKCFITSTYGGTAYGHTKNKKIAERLQEGWVYGEYKDAIGTKHPLTLVCNGSVLGCFHASREENAPMYYDFNIPPALVNLVREINDDKRLHDS